MEMTVFRLLFFIGNSEEFPMKENGIGYTTYQNETHKTKVGKNEKNRDILHSKIGMN